MALPTSASGAGNDVDDAGGQSGIEQRLDEVVGGERRVLRGLDDAGVAADDGGEQLPRGDGHGKIPRRDHAADAERLAHAHGKFIGQLRGRGVAEHAASFAGHVVGGVDGFLHVAARLFEHLAHFAGHVAGALLLALDEHLAGAEEDLGTTWGGHEAPAFESFFRGIDGVGDISCIGRGKCADQVAIFCRIAILKRLAGVGADPFAANQILKVRVGLFCDCHCLHCFLFC